MTIMHSTPIRSSKCSTHPLLKNLLSPIHNNIDITYEDEDSSLLEVPRCCEISGLSISSYNSSFSEFLEDETSQSACSVLKEPLRFRKMFRRKPEITKEKTFSTLYIESYLSDIYDELFLNNTLLNCSDEWLTGESEPVYSSVLISPKARTSRFSMFKKWFSNKLCLNRKK